MTYDSATPPRALAFDAYGTLFDVHAVTAALEEHFPGRGRELSERWRAKQLEYTWLLALMGRYHDFAWVTERALIHACRSSGLALETETRRGLMALYLRLAPYPEVPAALERLAGWPMIILSNGSRKMLDTAVEDAGLGRRFAGIVSADRVSTYKPSPRVYALASEHLGVPTPEIGFVSSNGFDVAGAKAFGFQTFWLNRSGAVLDPLDLEPDGTLERLTDLADRIAG
ncbi:MAG: haloacid dehalogenase type II [Gammaproteobacteria bacterium]|nr:haloacid dehalogenase type II [Gammaproteobacteria bacterium]